MNDLKQYFEEQIIFLSEDRFEMFKKDFQKVIIFWENVKAGNKESDYISQRKKEERYSMLILDSYLNGRKQISHFTVAQKLNFIMELSNVVENRANIA